MQGDNVPGALDIRSRQAGVDRKMMRCPATAIDRTEIDGQLRAGFVLAGFHEDWQPSPRFLIDRFVPTFIATCAIKNDLGL
ncbi:hypothetical protein [Ensifer sp. B1-9]|uniref:hypothetical protein n=1 Tax=Ensifer sp. B1-9 TaxID=3141455 RepID=UPI003D1FF767